MSIELKSLTIPELHALVDKVKEEIARRQVEAKDRLKQEITEKLKNSGLDIADLFPEAGKKAKKAKQDGEEKTPIVKYRDPVSQETWSGRGARPPQWVKTIMSQRHWSLEQFKTSGEYDV